MKLPELDISRLKILVVDDCQFMRKTVVGILNALGCYDIVTATDGADALEAVNSRLPHIIICNWHMSPMDGLEFVRILRAQTDQPEEMVTIIMLTAHTENHRVTQARDAGVSEFLAKPISAKVLYSRLVSVIMHPRPFVRAPGFVGPCRRRHDSQFYVGDKRRSDDVIEESAAE